MPTLNSLNLTVGDKIMLQSYTHPTMIGGLIYKITEIKTGVPPELDEEAAKFYNETHKHKTEQYTYLKDLTGVKLPSGGRKKRAQKIRRSTKIRKSTKKRRSTKLRRPTKRR